MPLRTLFRHLLKYFLSESLSNNFLVLKKLLNLYFKFFAVDFILHDVQRVIMSNAHTFLCKIAAPFKKFDKFWFFLFLLSSKFFFSSSSLSLLSFFNLSKIFFTYVCFLFLFSSFHKLPPFSRFLITFYQVITHIYEDSHWIYFINK